MTNDLDKEFDKYDNLDSQFDSYTDESKPESNNSFLHKLSEEFAQPALTGLTQGALLSGADELGGAILATAKSVPNLMTFNPSIDEVKESAESLAQKAKNPLVNPLSETWLKNYRESQGKLQEYSKEMHDRSPAIYNISELVGGVLASPFSSLANIFKTGGRAAIKEALKRGGKTEMVKVLGKEAVKDAANSIIPSATISALSSEGNLSTPEGRDRLLKDTAYGTGAGMLVGGTIGLGGNIIPSAAQHTKNAFLDVLEPILGGQKQYNINKSAFELGKKGIGLNDAERSLFVSQTEDSFVPEIAEKLIKGDKQINDEFGKIIENSGHVLNLSDDYLNFFNKISPFVKENQVPLAVKKELNSVLNGFKNTSTPSIDSISASNSKKLIDQIDGLISKYYKKEDPNLQEIAKYLEEYKKSIKTKLLQDPAINSANSAIRDYRENVFEPLLKGSGQKEKNYKDINIFDRQDEIKQKISDILYSAGKAGTSGDQELLALNRFKKGLETLKQKNPQAYSNIEKEADSLPSVLKERAEQAAAYGTAAKTAPMSGVEKSLTSMVLGGGETGAGFQAKMSNWAGKISKTGLAGIPVKWTKQAFFHLPLDSVKSLASELSKHDNKTIRNFGEALMKASMNNDAIGRNAVMFAMMQNPNVRNALNIEDENK